MGTLRYTARHGSCSSADTGGNLHIGSVLWSQQGCLFSNRQLSNFQASKHWRKTPAKHQEIDQSVEQLLQNNG